MRMWCLIFLIVTSSALSVKEHWREESEDETQLRRGIYYMHIKNGTLWNIAPMAVSPEPGRSIDLSSLRIRKIRNHVFDYLSNVTVLNLTNNELENIPPFIFARLKTLQTLSLANNKLRTFDRNFIGLMNLRSLDLSNNMIDSLTSGDLLGLPKAVHLITAGNPLKKIQINYGNSSPYYLTTELNWNPWNQPKIKDFKVLHMWEDLTQVPAGSLYGLAWRSCSPSQFSLKLCETNGVLESLKIGGDGEPLEGCSLITPSDLSLTLNLENLGIRDFKSTWYSINKNLFETISFNSNKITEITPELLSNLPNSVVYVKLEYNGIYRIRKGIILNKFLKKISFNFNKIEYIEDNAFEGTNFLSISLASNNLKNHLDFVKSLPENVEELILNENKISRISEDLVTSLKRLRRLEMSDNEILFLSSKTFRGLEKLRIIDLSRNSLEEIEVGTFEDQKELSVLKLNFNYLKELSPGIFKGLERVRSVSLSRNEIEKIGKSSFLGLRNVLMDEMDLSGNSIDFIEEGSFFHMNIKVLDVSANNLSGNSVEKGAFEGCTVYELIYDSNPINKLNENGFDGFLLFKNDRFYLQGSSYV